MWYSGLCNLNQELASVKLSSKKLAKMKNNIVFQNEFVRNLLDAINNRYKITGLPDTCSERVIMQSLLWTGCVYFFEMDDNVLALPGAPDGSGLNVYGDYAGAWVWGANGFNQHIQLYIEGSDDSTFLRKTIGGNKANINARGVMVRENQYMFPFINQVMYYSDRQADTLRKLEVAMKNAATPYLITAEESTRNTIKAMFDSRDNNEMYILNTGIFPADSVQLLPFDIQASSITVMSQTYDWYSNHYRELCGTKNMTNIDKKGENLITPEVNINDQYTAMQVVLPQLNHDIDIVNNVFGLNLQVEAVEDENIQRDRQDQFVSNDDRRQSEGDDQ